MCSGRDFYPLHKIARIIGLVIVGVIIAGIFALLFGWFIELLWNGLMPVIFKLGKITYWQAVGIVLLARLIFGGVSHGHPHHPGYHHWHKGHGPGDGDKWHCRDGWRDWKHYDSWWHEVGKAVFEKYLDKVEHKEENPE